MATSQLKPLLVAFSFIVLIQHIHEIQITLCLSICGPDGRSLQLGASPGDISQRDEVSDHQMDAQRPTKTFHLFEMFFNRICIHLIFVHEGNIESGHFIQTPSFLLFCLSASLKLNSEGNAHWKSGVTLQRQLRLYSTSLYSAKFSSRLSFRSQPIA